MDHLTHTTLVIYRVREGENFSDSSVEGDCIIDGKRVVSFLYSLRADCGQSLMNHGR